MAPTRNYTPQQMGQALEGVKAGLSVGTAAKKYGVPRITLRNKVTGKSPAHCGMGPPTVLTAEEENILKDWIFASADRHFPISKDQLLDSVQQIIILADRRNPFTDNRPGKKWFNAFLRRHPDIAERVAQNLTTSRDDVTERQINSWFTEVENYLKSRGLEHVLNDPKRIYNTDESAFFLNPKPGRVLVRRGDKNIYATSGNEKENLTVLLTANAAGDMAPPMIVLSYERVPSNIANSIPDSYGIGKSDTGWMCGDTFYEYVTNIFHPWLIQNKIDLPVIFFLDGHRSHLTVHLSDFCSKNGIEVIALYPNSTHILQPMDIAVFRPLKAFWKKEVRKWKTQNLGHQVKKENFAPILKSALENISKECIKNGFKAGGLYPFGPEQIDFSKLSTKNRIGVELKEQVSLEQNSQFLKNLENEIAKIFTNKKLHLFNRCFYMEKSNLEKELPIEDLSLYIIWKKYKKICVSVLSTTDTDHQNENASMQLIQSITADNPSGMGPIEQTPQKDAYLSPSLIDPYSNNKNEITPSKCMPSTSFETGYTPFKKNIIIPSPFKKALFWPEPLKKKGKFNKEKVPSAITSKAWKEYNEKKDLRKKALEQEKEKRKLEKLQKKQQKEEEKQLKKYVSKKKSCKVNIKRRKVSVTSNDATDSDVTYAETDDSELDNEANIHSEDSEFTNEFKRSTHRDTNFQREERVKETVTDKMVEEYIVSKERVVEEMEVDGMITDEMITEIILKEKESVEIEAEMIVPSENILREEKVSKTTADENKENEETHDEYDKQNHKKDTQGNKHSGLNILSDIVVHTILDEKTGNLTLTPSTNLDVSFNAQLTTRSNDTLNIPEASKEFVLAKFKSQNGKKLYQYACRIEEFFDNKIVVQGLKSKKCKKIFKLVEKDISIIDENDIITYLPNPVLKDDCFIFPHCIQVKEQ